MDLSDTASTGASLGILIGNIVGSLVAYAINSYLLSRIFAKAGRKPYEAWIPILNIWRLYEMGDKPGWWTILLFLPIANIVAVIMAIIAFANIIKKFGKPGWYVILLFVFPIIIYIILGFTDCTWQEGSAQTSSVPAGPPMDPNNQSFPGAQPAPATFGQPTPPVDFGQPISPEISPIPGPTQFNNPEPVATAQPVDSDFSQATPAPAAQTDFSGASASPSLEPSQPVAAPVEMSTPSMPVEPTEPAAPVEPASGPIAEGPGDTIETGSVSDSSDSSDTSEIS